MHVLVVSTYELGHQPLLAASAAAALAAAGHVVTCADLAVEQLEDDAVDTADAVAFAVPMHTATRLALVAAEGIRRRRPDIPVCLFGLYAGAATEALDAIGGGSALAGEFIDDLLRWAEAPEVERRHTDVAPTQDAALAVRDLLPPLEHYAKLAIGDETRLAGYVEATRGCTQRCRHCPVPVVYRGRLRVVDPEAVIADVDQLVGAGARHITFGDPDFLCSPPHARRVLERFEAGHPDVTFDITTKVSHILANPGIWDDFAAAGLLFVTSAVECLDDSILAILAKGHTGADAHSAVRILAANGIDLRPSFLPFTPWTTPAGVADILDFVLDHHMVDVVEAVQYSLRLLIPPGSLLLGRPEMEPYLDGYDPARFTWDWHAADPATDELCTNIADVVADAAAAGTGTPDTFRAVYGLVASATGHDPARADEVDEAASATCRPHLTEAWYCCAEPTAQQLAPATLTDRATT